MAASVGCVLCFVSSTTCGIQIFHYRWTAQADSFLEPINKTPGHTAQKHPDICSSRETHSITLVHEVMMWGD